MESRLPKPVCSATKPIQRVPADRLNGNNTTMTGRTNHQSRQPLLTNFQNIRNEFKNNGNAMLGRKRAASPDLHKGHHESARPKMRRSRSASDIQIENVVRFASRAPGSNMPTIPSFQGSKFSRSATTLAKPTGLSKPAATATASRTLVKPNATMASRTAAGAAGKTGAVPKIAAAKTNTVASRPGAKAVASSVKNVTTTTAAGAAGAAKPKAKIPPYDFKARFLDLQEKHKALRDKHQALQDQLGDMETLPEQYEECQNELNRVNDELKNVRVELECAQRQNNANEAKINALTTELKLTTNDLTTKLEAKTEECRISHEKCNTMKIERTKLDSELREFRGLSEKLTTENTDLIADVDKMKEMLFKFHVERKDLHNTIMDLRGNIRVFCRVRPPLESEMDRKMCTWQYFDESTLEISNQDAAKKLIRHEFSFDQVFAPTSTQTDIFDMVSPLIQSALDGYNICIFAYGQTGSGKTYTMDGVAGESDSAGIIPRTVDLLFECFKQYQNLGWEYDIRASFLEIYNEVLFDLLSNETKDMDIKMSNPRNPMEIYVSNLTEVPVSNGQELHELMGIAKSNRATASTVGNERSSRSHAVTRIQLRGTHAEKGEVSVGTINLIDLAGSESPKTSVRMDETKKINKSLSELTNVIMALLQKNDHVPYRNSKLTHLLMPGLGGNSKTLMFINVSPLTDCFVESVKSLRFAASVNSCKVAKAKKNKFVTPQVPTPPNATPNGTPNSSISSN